MCRVRRTQKEVVSGKGQFVCGAKGCDKRAGLASYEVCLKPSHLNLPHMRVMSTAAAIDNPLQVNLGYVEAGVQKNALVKLRVCPEHGLQLNHKKDAAVLKVGLPGMAKQRA